MLTDLLEAPGSAAAGSLAPPPGCAADWTIPQHWERFTAEDHRVWDLLFARQQEMLEGRAVRAFSESLGVLKLSRPGIPNFEELNERLFGRTGWTVVSVPGLVPDAVFFEHLAARRFPAGNFIRSAAQLDYLEEPDVFHDVFGHVPLLAVPAVADFMQRLGELGLDALDRGRMHRLARLYWYTVEFGLMREGGDLRIFGAGILSSFGESRFSLESPEPQRPNFELGRVMRTTYRTDAFQKAYFVIESFDDLLARIEEADLGALYERIEGEPDLAPGRG
ncbi:MAG TPA: phenylalanine 4-monooxygenase [Allosphingosinicella sp.]|jgi:phenylalanine-4-hydroxylase